MSEIAPVNSAIAGKRHGSIIRENALLTLVLCSVVRATQVLAGEQPSNGDSSLKRDSQDHGAVQAAAVPMFSAPFVSVKPLTSDAFSATEFRPRKHSVGLDSPGSGTSIIDAPMLQSTSIWQQMADYKSQDRVRLLTLWQTRGSSVSLQAGKHGAPSLQWSTPWVHREGTSRGLFDRLLAVPTRAAGNNLRSGVPHPTGVPAPPRSLDFSSAISTK
jgi:hypothetical protein